MEQLRRVLLYEFFIQHFIGMAKMSYRFHATNQSMVYLKQALRLCSLLQEDGHSCDMYVDQIDAIHCDVLAERNRDTQWSRPQLPTRRESTVDTSNKIEFRSKSLRCTTEIIQDPYTNLSVIPQNPHTLDNKRATADVHEGIDQNRYLVPHKTQLHVKHKQGSLNSIELLHDKQSSKSPKEQIKSVNEVSYGTNKSLSNNKGENDRILVMQTVCNVKRAEYPTDVHINESKPSDLTEF